ncbi:MAG: 30S ribosomal protein S12 methylthiotransferase RimO [Candidatus Aureabacteria bacterium]|nr:30S ribosomal protein S12 methylthiotransferase RimO [Candidatus Auribacterota bacterium]
MNAFIQSFGCPKNLVDTERIIFLAEKEGLDFVENPANADVIIINTCAFIKPAVEESVKAVLEATLLKGQTRCKRIIVAGCLVTRYGKELFNKIPAVDCFIGPSSVEETARIIRRYRRTTAGGREFIPMGRKRADFRGRTVTAPGHYAYLKLSEGCSNNCSFCTIPMIRGRLRSRPAGEIIEEAKILAGKGVKELIIIGQDIASYGSDRGRRELPALLKKIEDIGGIRWIRLMYMHPAHITDGIISAVSDSEKICRYMDIPLQHVNDGILRAMNRKITGSEIAGLIDTLRNRIEGLKIRSTFIVGFPGETKKIYRELKDFVKSAELDRMGAFVYSPEEETAAYNLNGRVGIAEAVRRHMELMDIQKKISSGKNKDLTGKRIRVIIDSCGGGDKYCVARSQWDAPDIDCTVRVSGGNLKPGDMVDVFVGKSSHFELFAECK